MSLLFQMKHVRLLRYIQSEVAGGGLQRNWKTQVALKKRQQLGTERLCTLSVQTHFRSPPSIDLAAVCTSMYHTIHNLTRTLTITPILTLYLSLALNLSLAVSYLTNKHTTVLSH